MAKPRSGTRAQEFVSLDGQACYQHVSRKWNAPRQGSSDRWLPSVRDSIGTPLAPSTLIRQTGSGKITGLAMGNAVGDKKVEVDRSKQAIVGIWPDQSPRGSPPSLPPWASFINPNYTNQLQHLSAKNQ